MNINDENIEKMSPLYFYIFNTIKEYLNNENIKYIVNSSNNIELFTIPDYKIISNNILILLKSVDEITIDKIEFLWSKNMIIKLENKEMINVFCHISCIEEIKEYIKNIIQLKKI